jgi:hypothetical protein
MLMVMKAYLIRSCRAAGIFAIHSALAALIYLCLWLLERFIHLFSSSEPMLWDYVPMRYVFDGGEALMVAAVAIHGLKDVWTALESGQESQRVSTSWDEFARLNMARGANDVNMVETERNSP